MFDFINRKKNIEIQELKKDIEVLTQFSQNQFIDQQTFNILSSNALSSSSFNDDVLIEMWSEVPEVSTVISQISGRAKSIPWRHYKITDKNNFAKMQVVFKDMLAGKVGYKTYKKFEEISVEPIFDANVDKLLANPNELQSWSEMIEQFVNFYYVIGNSYLCKLGPYGFIPDELDVMESQQTDVVIKKSFLENPFQIGESAIEKYTFEAGGGKKLNFDPDIVLHMKAPNLHYKNGAWRKGYPPLGAAILASKTLKHEYLSRLSLIRDRGMMGMLVGNSKGGVPPTSDQTTAVYQRLQKFGLGDGKKNAFAATNGDYRWLSMSFNSGELELLKGREENLKVLARKMNVPTDLLIGDSSFNNVNTAGKVIYTSNIIPLLSDLKDKLNPFIGLTQRNQVIMPVYDDIAELQADLKVQTEIMVQQYNNNLITKEEARDGLGRSPEPELGSYKDDKTTNNEIQ